MYRVYHAGRCHRFETLEAATVYCGRIFRQCGLVLGIEKYTPRPRRFPAWNEAECGGAFDGVSVSSDADSGL